MVIVSRALKKIALVEVCRPMDESADQLAAAETRKLRTYAPLLAALRKYEADGWQIEILPWVVGVRGLLMKAPTQHVLDFLAVPRKSWDGIIEGAAIASVKAFYFSTKYAARPFTMATRRPDCAKTVMLTIRAGVVIAKENRGRMRTTTRHAGSDSRW
eukprot:CAMPEP_0172173828 /NCGR_PEP_ID=MMETSP1050-20130122/13305_1 /TAXON_ID=233186 /ORGANISM="Cryptomonas curvata, Strain CCAP979/52" /LENGTH=157 /DNA_ID=CAMNT_0012845695 /DNA_START=180 /DNA_END=650 /DNA_ORIENTATION=+